MNPSEAREGQFDILEEKIVYKRYLKIVSREVRRPDGAIAVWDVAQTSNFVTTVPYHTNDGTITLIREYGQGPNEYIWALAGGCYEPKKTPTLLDAAKAELSEEARLTGGQWIPLLPEDSPGIVELKWVANRFWPFLVVDPVEDPSPGKRDVEEEYIVIERLSIVHIKDLILRGRLALASMQSIIMAIDHLQRHGYRIEGW